MSIGDLGNATLQAINSPGVVSSGGDLGPAVPGPTINVRCILDEPTFLVRRLIEEAQLDANAVLYVDPADFPAAVQQLVTGATVLVLPDGSFTVLVMLIERVMSMSGALPYVRCLVIKQ